ncbi:hypothetical protein EIP91_009635 [Steccherinum ochraceum]|uniref:Uncharacterized protein n=1 Tax=Steccherinum ochraceum TaxID=92696 RepID=A0A4R0RE38_9APHY|nr:hypothetical protein EIP91_009635 [Steccherinum ochraceum]
MTTNAMLHDVGVLPLPLVARVFRPQVVNVAVLLVQRQLSLSHDCSVGAAATLGSSADTFSFDDRPERLDVTNTPFSPSSLSATPRFDGQCLTKPSGYTPMPENTPFQGNKHLNSSITWTQTHPSRHAVVIAVGDSGDLC